jgi:hypothetical protein
MEKDETSRTRTFAQPQMKGIQVGMYQPPVLYTTPTLHWVLGPLGKAGNFLLRNTTYMTPVTLPAEMASTPAMTV